MADDLTFTIGSTTDDGGLRAAARGLDDLADSADSAGDQLAGAARAADDLGDQARQSSRGVDDLGDAADDAGRDLAQLQRKIAEARVEMAALAHQFAGSGDAADYSKFRRASADIAKMQRAAKVLSDELGDLDRRRSGIKGLGDDLAAGARGLGSALTGGVSGIASLGPGLGVAAAAAAPLIGAAVTEGIMLGVGGAALAVGIAGAFRSSDVKAAWSEFAETGATVLEAAGQQFRAPLVGAFDDADQRLRNLDVAGAIAPLADTVGPLEQGLMGLAERAMPGIRTAAEAAVRPIEVLADELPDVGGAISDMLSAASVGAGGAAAAMQDLLTAAEGAVVSVGAIAGGLGKIYELADKAGMTGFLGFAGNIEGAHGKLVALNDEAHRTDPAAQEAVAGLQAMADAMTDLAQRAETTRTTVSSANQTLFDADMRLAEGYDRLQASVNSHGASLDINTQAGRSNIQVLEGMIGAAGQAADAEYAKAVATGNASGAESAANATRAAAIQRIREHAAAVGLDAWQVDVLIAKLAALPRGTLDFAYRVNVQVYGNVRAADAVMAVAAGKTSGLNATQINNAQQIMNKGRAAGGPAQAGMGYVVGDAGRPEVFVPGVDGTIVPRIGSPAGLMMPSAGSAGAAAAPSTWTLVLDSRGSRLDDLLVEIIREAVERGGGRVQDVLGRAGVT